MKKAFICLLLAAVAVSAQNKQRIAVLPSVGDLAPQGLIILTDKVREIATKNLPIDNFTILKQDVIINMIGEEELYRSCKEGVCIGDLAKKTNANYGARCDVIKFENRLVLKFELYSVNEEAIFETFTDINVKNFDGMIASLEARLPDIFKKMVGASDRALADARDKAREQQRLETKAQPEYKPTPKPEPAAPVPPATTLQSEYRQVTKPAPVQAVMPTPTKTTFTDSRDGKVYKKVVIGRQVWMAENLNYAAEGSKCYKNKSSNCEKYGCLYDWSTAMRACPAGWHLPIDAEWKTLENTVGGSAGKKLKSTSGWNNNGNGTDEYGFSALPGGYGYSDGSFYNTGSYGSWWSATEYNASNAWYRDMYFNNEIVDRLSNYKSSLYSVRCVAD
jgi:uncharacterized protein (TIGR02145 family)